MEEKKVVCGALYKNKERELASANFGYIQNDVMDIKNEYIRLGFHLNEACEMKFYEDFGYEDFYEYCEKNFGLDKSAVSRCIGVWSSFAMEQGHSRKMFLDDKYKLYSYSQLCEMLPLRPEQRRQIKPDMTVKQIREKKKEWKSQNKGVAKKVATSQLEQVEIEAEEVMQPDLPLMNNNDQRKEWLHDYKAWGLWYRDEHIDVNYYKYDFADGSRLIVAEYPQRENYYSTEKKDEYYFHLLYKKRKKYNGKNYDDVQYYNNTDCETYLIDFLKNLQKKK